MSWSLTFLVFPLTCRGSCHRGLVSLHCRNPRPRSPFPVHRGPEVGPSATQARCCHATTHSSPLPRRASPILTPHAVRLLHGAGGERERAPRVPTARPPGSLDLGPHTCLPFLFLRPNRAPPGKATSALMHLARLLPATQSSHSVSSRPSPESRRLRANTSHLSHRVEGLS